uniref:Integrase core domain-containing protein n=2 Tax=Nothobranchius pienaari TaxID=704102 RepID=A0A1A8MDN9_9TELE
MFCPFCGRNLLTLQSYCGLCGRNIEFLRSHQAEGSQATEVEGLIHKYFTEGHTLEVITDFLAIRHNISLSLSSLKRRLRDADLTRRINYTPIATVRSAIVEELQGSGKLLGYRAMWQILKQKYSFTVRRKDVMLLMREVDPSGIENRLRRRFARRTYHSLGPNEVWHVDGYDKLKPFGIGISGCIDGFSRKIMWLTCGKSNKDPNVIAQNYINCVAEFGVFPSRLRTDCGTENGLMAALQCCLRSEQTDEFAGARSHMYGTSMSNQRIESWWSYFRKQRIQFWLELFGDLRERHLFNGSSDHTRLLQYCFLDVLQEELNEHKQYWNTHVIRPVRQSKCPSGRPEAMYYLPHRFNANNCGFAASTHTLNQLRSLIPAPSSAVVEDDQQICFEGLQRQSGLLRPLRWE